MKTVDFSTREVNVKKREDEVTRREQELTRREDEVTKREDEAARCEIIVRGREQNVEAVGRLYMELIKDALPCKQSREELTASLNKHVEQVVKCCGQEAGCPKWWHYQLADLTPEELQLFRYVPNVERLRKFIYKAGLCRTKQDVIYRIMGTMYLTEPAVTRKVVTSVDFYRALLPFVPEEIKEFRVRQTVWTNTVDMAGLLDRELAESTKDVNPAVTRENVETIIKQVKEKEEARLEKVRAKRRKAAAKRRMAKRKEQKRLMLAQKRQRIAELKKKKAERKVERAKGKRNKEGASE